jgi:hypothetical protein
MLPGQTAYSLAGLLIGTFGDGAGIYQHQVRGRPRGRRVPPPERELPGHPGRVTLVYLAAEGDDMEKTVLGFGFSVFGGHFQGVRLKESQSPIFAKIWEKEMKVSKTILPRYQSPSHFLLVRSRILTKRIAKKIAPEPLVHPQMMKSLVGRASAPAG